MPNLYELIGLISPSVSVSSVLIHVPLYMAVSPKYAAYIYMKLLYHGVTTAFMIILVIIIM